MLRKNVWIRISVNKPAIQERRPERWRCYVDATKENIEVFGVRFSGIASDKNILTPSQADPDEIGLVGWLHVFCDLEVKDAIAFVNFRDI